MKLSLTFFCALALFFAADSFAAETVFKAGAVKRDITPKQPVPMWGYGARHSLLSGGTLDPLEAAVVVIQERPSLKVREERCRFESRSDFNNPLIRMAYSLAFSRSSGEFR